METSAADTCKFEIPTVFCLSRISVQLACAELSFSMPAAEATNVTVVAIGAVVWTVNRKPVSI